VNMVRRVSRIIRLSRLMALQVLAWRRVARESKPVNIECNQQRITRISTVIRTNNPIGVPRELWVVRVIRVISVIRVIRVIRIIRVIRVIRGIRGIRVLG
jgi:hypothetical protein